MHVNTVERVEIVLKVRDEEVRYKVNQSCKITNAVIDLVEASVREKRPFAVANLGPVRTPQTVNEWSDKYQTELLAVQALGLRPEQAFYVLQDMTGMRWH